MPVIWPALLEVNLTPTSTADESFSLGFAGAAEESQRETLAVEGLTVWLSVVEVLERLPIDCTCVLSYSCLFRR